MVLVHTGALGDDEEDADGSVEVIIVLVGRMERIASVDNIVSSVDKQ